MHSTGVRKNYDAATDRFKTSWAEISVGCEACHGQGSRHTAWAHAKRRWWPFGKSRRPDHGSVGAIRRWATSPGRWDPKTGTANRSAAPATLRKEVRNVRSVSRAARTTVRGLGAGTVAFQYPRRFPAKPRLYHADGQMRDEVYNYGSFKQSKMFAAGVTCSDCMTRTAPSCGTAATTRVCNVMRPKNSPSHPIHSMPRSIRGNVCVLPHAGCAPTWESTSGTITAFASRTTGCFRADGSAERLQRLPQGQIIAMGRREAIDRWPGPTRKGLQNYAPALSAAWEKQARCIRGACGRSG